MQRLSTNPACCTGFGNLRVDQKMKEDGDETSAASKRFMQSASLQMSSQGVLIESANL
jgi:hypothetical protein